MTPPKRWRLTYFGLGMLVGALSAMSLVILLFVWVFSTNPLPPFPWLSGWLA
jgi:hypothetical protein